FLIAGDENAVLESYRMADVVWVRGCHLEHHHLRDEDNDSAPNREHDLQYAVHHLWILRRHIPHADTQSRAPPAQYIAPAPDAEIDPGRGGGRIDGRNVDRLAEAIYVAPQLP